MQVIETFVGFRDITPILAYDCWEYIVLDSDQGIYAFFLLWLLVAAHGVALECCWLYTLLLSWGAKIYTTIYAPIALMNLEERSFSFPSRGVLVV